MIAFSILAGVWLVAAVAATVGICKLASKRAPMRAPHEGIDSADQGIHEVQTDFDFEQAGEDSKAAHADAFWVPAPSARSFR